MTRGWTGGWGGGGGGGGGGGKGGREREGMKGEMTGGERHGWERRAVTPDYKKMLYFHVLACGY